MKSILKKHLTITWVLIVIVVAVVLTGFAMWKMNASNDAPPALSGKALSSPESTQPEATTGTDFKVLVGRWVRTDTPYVIEIREVSKDGTLQAGYYNPRSINVSTAKVENKNGALEVFVELRDTNYPGSSYRLTYDRAADLLRGVYFQAVIQQNFDVAFRRLQTM